VIKKIWIQKYLEGMGVADDIWEGFDLIADEHSTIAAPVYTCIVVIRM